MASATKYTAEIWSLFNFSGIRYPTPFQDVTIFERNNNASVNIYGVENNQRAKSSYVYPIGISEKFNRANHFDLLYLQQDDANSPEVSGHYCSKSKKLERYWL